MEDRREDGKLETNGAGPPRPDPARLAPKLPGPIPWISTEPVSEDPPSAAPHPIGGVGPTTRAPRRSGSRCSSRAPPEASRHPALRLVGEPVYQAIAAEGEGVRETLKSVARQLLKRLEHELLPASVPRA